jgi:hypothetical protein
MEFYVRKKIEKSNNIRVKGASKTKDKKQTIHAYAKR